MAGSPPSVSGVTPLQGLHQHLPEGVSVELHPLPVTRQSHPGHGLGLPTARNEQLTHHQQQLGGRGRSAQTAVIWDDCVHPGVTVFIFSFPPHPPKKALGCVERALQTNFSLRVFQKMTFLCSSQPYSLLQIQYFDNTVRAEQQIGQEMKLFLKSPFLKRYPLGNSLCSPRTCRNELSFLSLL